MSSQTNPAPETNATADRVAVTLPTDAPALRNDYQLPMALALLAALEAVNVAKSKGWDVTATVVDMSGTPIVTLRGDGATIHTKDTAFRKAYTIVTTGPIFHITATSQFVALLSKYNALEGQALASTPYMMPLAGGVAIQANGQIIAGLGVGGCPGAANDEICALAAVAKIQDLLPH